MFVWKSVLWSNPWDLNFCPYPSSFCGIFPKRSFSLGLNHHPSSFCGIFPKRSFSLGLNHHPSSFAACSLRAYVRVLFWWVQFFIKIALTEYSLRASCFCLQKLEGPDSCLQKILGLCIPQPRAFSEFFSFEKEVGWRVLMRCRRCSLEFFVLFVFCLWLWAPGSSWNEGRIP